MFLFLCCRMKEFYRPECFQIACTLTSHVNVDTDDDSQLITLFVPGNSEKKTPPDDLTALTDSMFIPNVPRSQTF